MKTLYLIRHAKSSLDSTYLDDFDRPLNGRGKKDAPEMGKRLLTKQAFPDFILCSAAKRTRETCKHILNQFTTSNEIVEYKKELYHSAVNTLLQAVNEINNKHKTAYVIGHNPGISNFCEYLTSKAIYFPTSGIAKITFNVSSWQEISVDLGTLIWFDFPKNG